jgi:gamma-glutamylcyclotransferase (GGCT)/AIG2-like uncharacterized protein YtfP
MSEFLRFLDSVPIQKLFYTISSVGLILGLLRYQRNSRLRRIEWLASLYERFYCSDAFKRMRGIIDYQSHELRIIETCIAADHRHDLVEELVDYLNFFEFVASLWKAKQLKSDELKMLFNYYLQPLANRPFFCAFIHDYDFDNLERLLKELYLKDCAGHSLPRHSETHYVFVYGTLRNLDLNRTHQLLATAIHVGRGYYKGELFDIGEYPGAVPSHDQSRRIVGEVYLLHDLAADIEPLDKHEGCSSSDPLPHEYTRTKVTISLENRDEKTAWMYLYNQPVDGLKRIEGGDYAEYLSLKSARKD